MSVTGAFPRKDEYFTAFIRAAQYITHLTPKQDILTETGNALVRFYGADLVAFFERQKDGEITGHHWILPAGIRPDDIQTPATKKIVAEVLETGFLATQHLDGSGTISAAFLPITWESQTTAVMLVGHATPDPVPGELLDTYLAISGLVSTAIASAVDAFRNVSEKKLAEDALKKSEEQLRLFIEHAPAAVAMFDRGMKYLVASRRWYSDYNLGHQDITGRSHYDIFPELPESWKDVHRRCLAGESERNDGDSLVRPDGKTDWLQWEIHPWHDAAGGIGGIIIFSEVITARKEAEEELVRKNEDLNAAYEELTATEEELKANVNELILREQELRENEKVLSEALAEKEVLLSEIHHRVKNNLTAFISLLSLEGSYEETPAGIALKKDLQNRARSMALIHETLYRTNEFSRVDMDLYLRTLVEQIAVTYDQRVPVRTRVEANGVSLDLARATTCGLIINELITNSFKYAFPESFDCNAVRNEACTISVTLSEDAGNYLLTIRDNGAGLPESFNIKTAQSLGLKLVNFLARHQLRATIEIDRTGGTEFRIRFDEPKNA